MIKNVLILILVITLAGCELITIGVQKKEKPAVISINQKSPEGVLLVLKTELESNNIWGAAQVIAKQGGEKYSAEEKFNKHYDIYRIKRIFGNYPFNITKSDTINTNLRILHFEINYYQKYSMKAEKINDIWYIVDLGLEN